MELFRERLAVANLMIVALSPFEFSGACFSTEGDGCSLESQRMVCIARINGTLLKWLLLLLSLYQALRQLFVCVMHRVRCALSMHTVFLSLYLCDLEFKHKLQAKRVPFLHPVNPMFT